MIAFKLVSLAAAMIQGNQNSLTVNEAIVIALQNSFALKNAQETVNSNEEKVREARGNFGPKLTTNYQYLRYGHGSTVNIGGQNVTFVPLETNTWTNVLTMPLDIVGIWQSNVKSAKAGVEASRNTRDAAANDLKQNVRKSYLAVLRAKGLVGVAKQAVVNIVARVDQADKQYRAGAIAKIDLTRLQAQKASADADLITAENGYTVAKQALNLVMSRPIETEFEVAELSETPAIQGSQDKLILLGQDKRPEATSFRNTLVALDGARKYAGQEGSPSLNLTIQNQNAIGSAGFGAQKETNTAIVALAVPIYDSGIARARMKQVDATINQTKNSLDALKLSISQEVRTALTNMANAQARQKSAIEQNELAKEVVRIARIRRDAGEGTVLEIIDAETQWVTAQDNLINSTYDYLGAFADLQRAVGADDPDQALRQFEADMKGKK